MCQESVDIRRPTHRHLVDLPARFRRATSPFGPAGAGVARGQPGNRLVLPGAVYRVKTGAVDAESVSEFIQRLTDAAGKLPNGLDSPIELAICDGRDLQFIRRVDVGVWTTVPESGPLESYVLIRPHAHPGDSSGIQMRGAAAHADEELRWLTEPDDD